MKLPLLLLALSIGCSGSVANEEAPICDEPLPPTDSDGTPWPPFSAANSMLADCAQHEGYYFRRRGSCSDGKQFLSKGTGFVGDTYYFEGEALVGVSTWTDIISSCEENRGGNATCEEINAEEINCPYVP